jgi:tetratricopeptide (TPR) repeat protein
MPARLLFLWLSLACASVLAEDKSETESLARTLFVGAREAYERGDYASAYADFQLSYDLSQRPELLYNVGLAAQKLGRGDEALAAFEGYLAWGKGERAEEVRGRVAALRDLAAHQPSPAQVAVAPAPRQTEAWVAPVAVARAAEPAVPAPAPEPVERRGSARAWWIATGVVLVAAAIAVGVAVPLSKRDTKPDSAPEPNTGLTIKALSWAP